MTKKLSDLIISDLIEVNVWEHRDEDNIEFVTTTDKIEIFKDTNIGYIVLTEFILKNGKKYLGFCSPQDPSGLDYIQPVIFTDVGQVEFWRDNNFTEEDKEKALEMIGLNSADVFPIVFKTRIKCDKEYYTGTIIDFNKNK